MKCIVRAVFMACLLCASLLGCRLFIGMPKTGWELVGSRGFTGTGSETPVLACTPGGAYVANGEGETQGYYDLAVRSWDGTSWSLLGGDYLTTKLLSGLGSNGYMLTHDSAGAPVIGWIGFENGTQTFHIRKYVSGAWTVIADCAWPTTYPMYQALDMSMNPVTDKPAVLVFVTTSTTTSLAVYGPSGTTWNASQIGADFYSITASPTSARLGFDSLGNPWVDYVDATTTPSVLRIIHWNGSSWDDWSPSPTVLSNFVYDPVRFPPSGTPYVAFIGGSDNQRPYVMKQTSGTSWANVGTQPVTIYGDYSQFSFQLSSDGTPYVAEEETLDTGYLEVSVLKFDGTSWTGVGRRGFTNGEAGQMPSLSFDSSGALWVAYEEVGNNSSASVQKYVGGEN